MADTATDRASRRATARAAEDPAQRTASDITQRIRANPKYQELKRKRSTFGWLLTLCMFVVYYGYIALIAFNKEFLSQPIGAGVTTIGVPIGMGVIVFTILITGLYVRRANSEFDALTREILAKEMP
ncbi:DUF485 domain-containing protein [Ideonella sp. YS5]|uniref:DUF485 domain-containing protein n=1 Tax=Ideonella sp. YS5 TaxID=3453714 RepID=UPI003EEAF7A0